MLATIRQYNSNFLVALTIVIITKGRPGRALAKARFWAKHGCTVHVLDSSEMRDEEGDVNGDVGGVGRVIYYHEPASTIPSRLALVKDLVQTPYIMMQPDDDVFLPGALKSLIDSLEHRPHAVGASGVMIGLQRNGLGHYLMRINPRMLERANQLGEFEESFRDFMRRYHINVFYGVVRSDVFKIVAGQMGNIRSGPYAIEELFFQMGVNGMGKVLALPVVYWVRNPNVQSVDTVNDRSPSGRSGPWFFEPTSPEYKAFVRELSKVFQSGSGDPIEFCAELAKQGIEAYGASFSARHPFRPKKFVRVRKQINFAKSRLLSTKFGVGLRFTRDYFQKYALNYVLALAIPSRRRLAAGLMQPPFTFLRQASKAGLNLNREELSQAIRSLH